MPEPGWDVGAGTKPCSRCKQVKPLAEFGRNPATKSGRQSRCKACDCRRHKERYLVDPEFRARTLGWNAAYRRSELGSLVTSRAELRAQLRGAVKEGTKDRLRQRIAGLDGRIAELRAGRGRERKQERAVA